MRGTVAGSERIELFGLGAHTIKQPIPGYRFAGFFRTRGRRSVGDFDFALVAAAGDQQNGKKEPPTSRQHFSAADRLDGDFLDMGRLLL